MGQCRDDLYQQRFARVFDYIYAHLDESLDLYQLADVACLSPYHWHRLYQSVYGETMAVTVKRLRLLRAAGELVNSSQTIEKIAAGSGYAGLSSFNRAFSEVYGMPPARYRLEGSHTVFVAASQAAAGIAKETDAMNMHDVTITQQKQVVLTGLRHQGSYMNIGNAFEKLFGWFFMQHAERMPVRMLGIYFDDPSCVAEANLRSMACLSGLEDVALPEGFSRQTLVAGDYAVLRHKGPYSDMASAYQWLYGVWLPQSGRLPADQPCFEEYLNNPRDVAPTELLTDIFVPLQPA